MVIDALSAHYPGDKGYNPGSSIVQVAGVALPNNIDHYVKERLHAKRYIRYMDDFRVVNESYEFLETCRDDIGMMLNDIGLTLHPTKTMIVPMTETVPFLGFDFKVTGTGKVLMFVDSGSAKHMRRKIGRLANLEMRGERPAGTTLTAYEGWRAHASKGDSMKLIRRCDDWYEGLWKEP